MSIKMRMVSIIIAAAIAFSALIVGVHALTSYSVPISGNIVFDVVETDVYVNSVTLKNTAKELPNGGYQATDVILTDYSNWYVQSSSDIDISNANVFAGQTLEIDIDMNSTTTNPAFIKVKLSYQNLPSSVTVNSTSVFLRNSISSVYKIFIRNTSENIFSLSSINLTISFEEISRILQHDTTNDYYYVEMGTYPTATGNEYIRWRYFSNGSTPYTYNASTAPSGIGYFILQSDLSGVLDADGQQKLSLSFNNEYLSSAQSKNGWTNIHANDYATSAVRQYINGNNVYKDYTSITSGYAPSGRISNMLDDLYIDIEDDYVYSMITPRTLFDLYGNAGSSSSTPTSIEFPVFSDSATVVYGGMDTDRFWIPSYYELNGLCTDRTYAVNYHCRTPYYFSPSMLSSSLCYVLSSGDVMYGGSSANIVRFARAAFEMRV